MLSQPKEKERSSKDGQLHKGITRSSNKRKRQNTSSSIRGTKERGPNMEGQKIKVTAKERKALETKINELLTSNFYKVELIHMRQTEFDYSLFTTLVLIIDRDLVELNYINEKLHNINGQVNMTHLLKLQDLLK